MLAFALLLALVAQDRAATGPVSGDEPAPPPRCGSAAEGIIVCGNGDQSRFRLTPVAPRFEPRPLRPQFTLPGGGTGTVEATQHSAGTASVPSAMVRVSIPLGRKKKGEGGKHK